MRCRISQWVTHLAFAVVPFCCVCVLTIEVTEMTLTSVQRALQHQTLISTIENKLYIICMHFAVKSYRQWNLCNVRYVLHFPFYMAWKMVYDLQRHRI